MMPRALNASRKAVRMASCRCEELEAVWKDDLMHAENEGERNKEERAGELVTILPLLSAASIRNFPVSGPGRMGSSRRPYSSRHARIQSTSEPL